MDIGKIDKNMLVAANISEDVQWHDILDESKFSMHGIFFEKESGEILRLPSAVAKATSVGVDRLARHTSGGRLCFVTDSPYIAIHCKINGHVMSNMSWSGSASFDLYMNGVFRGLFRSMPTGEQTTMLYQIGGAKDGECQMELNFPLYAGVQDMLIGLKAGSTVRAAHPYQDTLPIVYYGSSITQGGCSTRPGMSYQSYICRDTLVDYVNLGFSGSGKGEPAIREYIASLPCSILVLDWDHNLYSVDSLKEVHEPMYRAFRATHPDTPVVFISRPDFSPSDTIIGMRRVIMDTYETARAEGDQNVYFIDGEIIFGEEHRGECTVDGCHPNDLGFYRFYQTLKPMIEKILK